jgi:hypothetical protein
MCGRLGFRNGRQVVTVLLLLTLPVGARVAAQQAPATCHDFLSQYRGREILLLDKTSDTIQFDDPDSTNRYVVVLDAVDDDTFVVHRGSPGNSYTYSLAAIRRITFLFNGRPYRRILVESY